MELILKSNNENSIAKIIALAKKLNVVVEHREKAVENKNENEDLKKRVLDFKAQGLTSFGDAAEWQRDERDDRNQAHYLKLGDSLIAATALVHELSIYTRNLSDFKNVSTLNCINPVG